MSRKTRDKIPRAFETLNRHIWYDQMKKNKERRVYTVVEHKVMIDPFFSRPAEYTALTEDDLYQSVVPDDLTTAAQSATTAAQSATTAAQSATTKRSRKSKATMATVSSESTQRHESHRHGSSMSAPVFPKTRVVVELFC